MPHITFEVLFSRLGWFNAPAGTVGNTRWKNPLLRLSGLCETVQMPTDCLENHHTYRVVCLVALRSTWTLL